MFDLKKLEELNQNFMQLLASSPAADIERNSRAMLSSFFSKLDLITREEFDIQVAVLTRTREKLEALEKRLDTLENKK